MCGKSKWGKDGGGHPLDTTDSGESNCCTSRDRGSRRTRATFRLGLMGTFDLL